MLIITTFTEPISCHHILSMPLTTLLADVIEMLLFPEPGICFTSLSMFS